MCHFNMLMANGRAGAAFSTTKNAFIKGTCTAEQKAILDAQTTSTTLIPTVPALDTYADTGIGTGTISYGSESNEYTIDLV